jgi:hypothetical protein
MGIFKENKMLTLIDKWTPEEKEIYKKVQGDLIEICDYIGSIEAKIGDPVLEFVLQECIQNISIANNTMIARIENTNYDPEEERDYPKLVKKISYIKNDVTELINLYK